MSDRHDNAADGRELLDRIAEIKPGDEHAGAQLRYYRMQLFDRLADTLRATRAMDPPLWLELRQQLRRLADEFLTD